MLNINACRLCWGKMLYGTLLSRTDGNWEHGVLFLCPRGCGSGEGWWPSLAPSPPKGCPYAVEHAVSQEPEKEMIA
jgi:hypothetical protein